MAEKRVEARWASEDDLKENKRTVRISLTAAQFRREVDSALWSACQGARLKGFRPGKVPLEVGRRLWGQDAVSKVAEDLVARLTEEALKDPRVLDGASGLPVRGAPELSDSGLSWDLTVPLKPKPAPGTSVDFSKAGGAT